jgi:hypothetical protein
MEVNVRVGLVDLMLVFFCRRMVVLGVDIGRRRWCLP